MLLVFAKHECADRDARARNPRADRSSFFPAACTWPHIQVWRVLAPGDNVHEAIRPTRLLVYSHDGFGLGNLSRTLKICERLSQEIPSLSILLLTGSPLAQAFRLPARVDYVKLPSVVRRARDQYVSRILRTPFKRLSPMRADLIQDAIRGFRPHL